MPRPSRFRPSQAPRLALPFGVRSWGCFSFEAPVAVDRTGARPFVQLYWGIAGRSSFGFPDGEVVLHPGEVVVYPRGSCHVVSALEAGSEYRWATFDGPLADECVRAFGLVPPWPRKAGPAPLALFDELDRLLADPGPVAERQASAVGWALLSAASATQASGDDPVVEQVQEALVAGLADPGLGIETVADDLGLDRSVLSRRFAAAVGLSPKQWLHSLRLNRAMGLLAASDQPVQEVAAACGFATGNYFARVFKSATGETPEQFRRHIR